LADFSPTIELGRLYISSFWTHSDWTREGRSCRPALVFSVWPVLARFGPFLGHCLQFIVSARQDRRFVILNPSQLDSRLEDFDPRFDPEFDPGCDPRFDPEFDPGCDPRFDPEFDPGCDPRFDPEFDPGLIPFFGLLFSLPFGFERPRKLLVLFGFLGIAAGFVGFLKFGLQMLFH
jgi:hypothetical protein